MGLKFVQEGHSIDYTPESDTAAEAVVVQGKLVGVTKQAIPAGKLGALCVTGIFRGPKDSSNITAVGTPLFWDTDGSPVGGVALSGALTTTATGNTFAGWALEIAGAGVATVLILLRSANDADTMATDDLSDVGSVDHTAGDLLVADGTKFECVPVSGDLTLAANGAATLNAAHQEQVVCIPVADLAANGDLAATVVFAHPRASTLVSAGLLALGAFAGVDASNSMAVTLSDGDDNTIVTKTYDDDPAPVDNALNDLGTLDETHKVLTAGEVLKLAITNGTTADPPAMLLVLRLIPTNA